MDAQLEALRSAVATAETHFDQWCSGQHRRLGDMRVKHKDAVLANKENVATLEQDLASAKLAGEAMQAAVKEEAREEAERAQSVEQLRHEQDAMPHVLGELERTVEAARNEVTVLSQELEQVQQAQSHRLGELGKAMSCFQSRLGLRFERTKPNHLRFVFTLIDCASPDREFWFEVIVDSHDRYIIYDCVPDLDGIDVLVDQLNLDMLFAPFVVAMRHKFVQACHSDR